jgi:3-dehydroquinate dehydratase / shikimate dehydrogenase
MAHSQLCVAVTGRTMNEIRHRRDAVTGADLVEMRLDTVDRPDVAGALEGRRCPVIVTCRAAWEGGHFAGSEEERRRILEQALALGAEFVDVEARASFATDLVLSHGGRGIVLSSHLFGECPPDLEMRWHALRGSAAEIVKLAVETHSLSETLRVMDLARRAAAGSRQGQVLIAMGDAGLATRVLATRLGNRWTYAGDGVAPGQVSAARMLGEFSFRSLRPETHVYGVVGNPVMHSRSPVMHNAGFRHFGIDAVYLPLLASDAADFLTFARGVGMAGASITAPFKVALMDAAGELEPLARRVGAINTLSMQDGTWRGANTDVHGFAAPLAARLPSNGHALRVSILGAGGAARAVAVALADMGAAVTVCARRPEAAREVADLAGGNVGTLPPPAGSWDVLVNTTTWDGEAAGYSPIPPGDLTGRLVYDLLYAPPVTRLMADAQAAGVSTIGGLEMLVAQAEKQFEIWTGQAPPAGLFHQAARHIQS